MDACSLHALGDIALAKGDAKAAVQLYEAELASGQERQYEPGITFAFIGKGKVAWTRGDYEVATKSFEEVLRICQEISEKSAELLNTQHQRIKPLFQGILSKTYACAIAYPLDALALLTIIENKMERGARLLSTVETLYTPLRFEMSAKERTEHDQAIATARAALGEEAFTMAWEESKKVTLNEAIAYALQELNS